METPFLDFTLASDTWSPAHPAILAALAQANTGYAPAYGEDGMTRLAVAEFKKLFGPDIEVFFALSGTGANVAALAAMLGRGSGIVCADTAHINVHETGAPERLLSVKLLPCPHQNGKLTPAMLEERAFANGDPHCASADVVSLSQCTEMGTVYTSDELRALCDTAHRLGMLVHMDGARFAGAVAHLGCSAAEVSRDVGVDVLGFGGTKNGFVFGEAIVFFNTALAERFAYLQKQHLQMASKNRYIAAQFVASLQNGLWLETARSANAAAARLAAAMGALPGVSLLAPPQSNILFFHTPPAWHGALREWTDFDLEADGSIRLVTSWDTTDAQIDAFVERVKTLV